MKIKDKDVRGKNIKGEDIKGEDIKYKDTLDDAVLGQNTSGNEGLDNTLLGADVSDKSEISTYYVGVGASAGGLEALQDFFKYIPADTGMVFIVIQHLSPDYKSLMDELLARHTKMPIKIAGDGMKTEPNTVYLIPPKNNLSIFHGRLFLEEQKEKKVLNLPIDIFFRSLAVDKEKNAIGIILSGTGSDGTLGIKAIKEAGGMVMVQDEQSAKFDGMPNSCISTGLVDYILPPNNMADELLNYIKHPLIRKTTSLEKIMSENFDTLTKITLILRDFSGIDFSYYKENTIIRRLERRMSINRFNSLEQYLEYLSESDKEKDTLYRELLIGVTRFFRDQEAYNSLSKNVIPELLKNKKSIRIWSAGCSTGEEVYSMAMLFMDYIDTNKIDCELKIFATDIDKHSLEVAGAGFYPESVVADVDSRLMLKYLIQKENGFQVSDAIRKVVVFAYHNITKDPPFSKLDLLVCRNLFIYLKPEMQQAILSMFYYSLNSEGYLFMGSSESIGEMSEAFSNIDTKWKIYKYKQNFKPAIFKEALITKPHARENENRLSIYTNPKILNNIKLEKLMEGAVSAILPPSIIIDNNDNIIHVFNDINPFFKVRPGKFSQNIFSNMSNELSLFVSNLLRRLKLNKKDMVWESISGLKGFEKQKINIEGRIITFDKTEFYLLSFMYVPIKLAKKETKKYQVEVEKEINFRVSELEKELQITKEGLQATVEELETSNEELQSSNEELIASNEELQSTNEELQSVNEELYTVNSEYQIKIDELIRLNADLDNLLKNTEVGALYLDRNLCIRRITPIVTKITNILPTDIGRPISHISVISLFKDLMSDINHVVETLQSIESEVKDAEGNIWLTRIYPYRTEYNSVDGVIITFIDINQLKKEQEHSKETSRRLELALDIGRMAWWEWDLRTDTEIYDIKKSIMLGYSRNEFPEDGEGIFAQIHPDDIDMVRKTLADYLRGNRDSWEVTYRLRKKDGSYSWFFNRGIVVEREVSGNAARLAGIIMETLPK